MTKNNIFKPFLAEEQRFNSFVSTVGNDYEVQIIPDSTIDSFQYTIKDPEDSNLSLLLNYEREQEKMTIESLQGNFNWVVKVSETEVRDGLGDLPSSEFFKRIVKYGRQTDNGFEVSYNEDVKKAYALELKRSSESSEESEELLYLLLVLEGTIIGSTVYKQLLEG